MISFYKIQWNNAKKSSLGVITHACGTITRVPQLEHNFGLRSDAEHRVWCHIQHETQQELETLKQIISKHSLHGRRQNLPSKIDGCYSPLNLNNNINCVLADADADATFLRRNLRNSGADLIFCDKVELKIRVRFKSEIA